MVLHDRSLVQLSGRTVVIAGNHASVSVSVNGQKNVFHAQACFLHPLVARDAALI